ncbi:hypothetical protein INT43_003139 [Umbelopsis isabellina]|uniref:Uncharacterized protein n=1 Tax=Mortierella isabellina TaxID=91625 RepID=A0A8H7UDT7_MORIS|nr:hypothetical protein INT43_003139 [Umbelopsis isabellina]
MACLETRPSQQHTTAHLLSDQSDPKLDDAVKQLLQNYMAPLPSQLPKHQHQYHHRRNLSVDLRQQTRHHSPKRTSTSWLSNNAGFENDHFHAKQHVPIKRSSTPVQPSMPEVLSPKPRRFVTFEDEASQVIRTIAVSPEPISNTEARDQSVADSNEPTKPQQRQKGLKALFHFEKPKILVKRATL